MSEAHPGLCIADRYQLVLERIEIAAAKVGRIASEIRLAVVTKGQPIDRIDAVIDAGARILGENYFEEAVSKILRLERRANLEWHMIGHVQSRKAAGVVEHFNLVHSVDSVRLAQKLAQFAQVRDKQLPVYLQFNMSSEQSKYGFPAWDEAEWKNLLPGLRNILELGILDVKGLMTLPPYFDEPENARVYFRQLRKLRDYFRENLTRGMFTELSMGMSGDFEVAIEEGATIVRIGTAIMGERDQPVVQV